MPKQFITSIADFNPDNLVFSLPKDTSHGSKFIFINYNNGEDTGPLMFHMKDYFCFGVDGNYAPNDRQKTALLGYKIPIPLWGTTTKTAQHERFFDVLNAMASKCAEHLSKSDTRKLIKKPEYTKDLILPKIMPLWFKRNEDLEIDEGTAPVLYAKLKTDGEAPDIAITTAFKDTNGNLVDPLELIGKKFPLDALLKVESIFVGTQPKIQMKLLQVAVHVRDEDNMPSIFSDPPAKKRKMEEAAQEDQETEAPEGVEEEAEEEMEEELPLFFPSRGATPHAPNPSPVYAEPNTKRKRKAL